MIYMGSTKILAGKTAGEIMGLLGSRGATQILTEYMNGEVSALSFIIDVNGASVPFRLPIRHEKCLKAMIDDYRTPRHLCNIAQAKRTAWRIALRWIQAQFSMIDTGMVTLPEVFLSYVQVGEQTLYDKLAAEQFKLIPYQEEKR